jgi:class 3 adenylate cyclase
LVADIVGSTRLYETLGDTSANRIVGGCLGGLGEIVRSFRGLVRTSAGDAVLCTFDGAADAAVAACEMQLAVQQQVYEGKEDLQSLRLRVGVDCGVIASNPFDMLSETVAITRHVVDLAKPEQILITRATYAELPGVYKAMTRYVDREPWRGTGTSHLDLYELIWEVDGLTAHAAATFAPPESGYKRVRLTLGSREFLLDDNRPVITVGREPVNDIVVDFKLVSREHFKVALRHGQCMLTDTSTNGTFIVLDQGATIPVMRERLPLRGSGGLHFGVPSAESAPYTIRYACEE